MNNFAAYEDGQHAKRISLQLLTAAQQCHDLNVFHRDLKPDNILLTDGGTRVVISDFGLSTRREQTVDFRCGSEVYMSPGASFSTTALLVNFHQTPSLTWSECLGDLHCTTPYRSAPSDVWSLGIIVFCIFFGVPPWSKPSSSCTHFKSFLMDPDFFLRRYPISVEFHRLLMGVLTVDPIKRTTLREFISTVRSIDPSNFTYRSNPGKLFASRAGSLRLLSTKLIRAHVENELSALLDTSRLLRKHGLHSVVPLERDDHLTKLFSRQQAKLPGYVCSLAILYPVDVIACDPPSILLDTIATPSVVCGTAKSLSEESNTMPMTP